MRRHRPFHPGLLGDLVAGKFSTLALAGLLFLILPGATCGKREPAKPAGRESSRTLPTKESLRALYYKDGKKTEITLDSLLCERVRRLVDTLSLDASETLKLLVDDERIEDLKKTETSVEILFKPEASFLSRQTGTFTADKIFLPFSGDFVGTDKDPIVTVFAGDKNGYFSGPLRNPNGYASLMELRALLESAASP